MRETCLQGLPTTKGADPSVHMAAIYAQTDQHLCYLLIRNIISKHATDKISIS